MNLTRLHALALAAIEQATDAMLAGGSVSDWQAAMRAALIRGHTAATIAGVAERSAGGRVRSWLARIGLEQAIPAKDRAMLRRQLGEQLQYLERFATEIGSGAAANDAQNAARARMYAGSVRGTWSRARWGDYVMPFHPGEGSPCLVNCRCSWDVEEKADGLVLGYWKLSSAEHCAVCQLRSDANPHVLRNAAEEE